MFELSKNILEKVSFDETLFRKELLKAEKWLKPEEKILLMMWCYATFGHCYEDAITEVYNSIMRPQEKEY